jgi:hypothetical protein
MMKQVLCLLLVCSSLQLTAQQTDEKAPGTDNQKQGAASNNRMNIVKVNLTALPLKNFSFQYERVLQQKISAALGIRLMPNGNLPLKESLNDAANGDPDIEKAINNAQIGNFSITPEFRFYPGKKGYGRGFYIAPYYRYAKFTADAIPIDYTVLSNTKTITLKGDMTTHSGGFMLGAQWFLGKYVTLDWWIVGAHYGAGNGAFVGTPSSPFNQMEQNEVRQTIEDIDLPVGKITAEVTANSAKAIFDGPWGGLRGGIAIGFRF